MPQLLTIVLSKGQAFLQDICRKENNAFESN
jgi:hypothetical protein